MPHRLTDGDADLMTVLGRLAKKLGEAGKQEALARLGGAMKTVAAPYHPSAFATSGE